MEESKKKTMGFIEDNLGDKSSKRLTAFILLGFSIAVGLFGIIFDACTGFPSIELVKYIFTASLSGSLLSLGLTLPELFSTK